MRYCLPAKRRICIGSLSGLLLRGQHRSEDDKYAPGFWFYSLAPFRNGVYRAEGLLSSSKCRCKARMAEL